MGLRRAIDVSNYSGMVSTRQAQVMRELGFARVIVGTQLASTTQQQLDAFGAVGLEREAYVYLRFDRDTTEQVRAAIEALGGRVVRRLWLDCEDETAVALSSDQVVDAIQEAADACIGVVFSGIYTRRDWWVSRTADSARFAEYPLWDCTADGVPDLRFRPYGGWQAVAMEQYAFDRRIEGLTCDLNVYSEPDPVDERVRQARDLLHAVVG